MRILQFHHQRDLKQIMRDIRVDPYGIRIMAPKAAHFLIRLNSVSNFAANILKQEMLSLGGDAAIARGALTGRVKKTDCLLMGNLTQFSRLKAKLKKQPFGLARLADEFSDSLSNYQQEDFILDLGGYKLRLGHSTLIMAIMNITPDSFSGDGLYGRKEGIIDFAARMVACGADIIDVGGESTRPGARPVSLKEEIARVIPVVKLLAKKIKVPISVDTYKPEVARVALDNGAVIINDITGLRNPGTAKVASRYKAGVVIMHMRGKPATMQRNTEYASLIDEIIHYLQSAIKRAQGAGIDRERIIIDPGLGFAKTARHNLQVLNNLQEFKVLGRPIMIGPSRKSFLGGILNVGPKERVFGTVAACVVGARNGAKIVRVHDVLAVKQALKIQDCISKS